MSVFLSVVAHGGVLAFLSWLAFVSLTRREAELNAPRERFMEVAVLDLPVISEGTIRSDERVVPQGIEPVPAGGARVPRIDTGEKGRGGERKGAKAEHLADTNDRLSLTTDLVSHLDRAQAQRIWIESVRKAHDDRRSSKDPMELTFLASGQGQREERRSPSPSDPSRGALASISPSVAGGVRGANKVEDGEQGARAGASQEGTTYEAPGRGVHQSAAGTDHRLNADVTHARPSVQEAAVSIASINKGRPTDNVDSDQKVTALVQSLIHASAAGGIGGHGEGGSEGGGDPGAGGRAGPGSHSPPLGVGDGDVVDFGTRDPGFLPYFRKIHGKIDPLWTNAFPKSAILDLKQGTVILEFTIFADGSTRVSWPPVRPSGIEEFDRNCADAIRRAAPFGPIPPELGLRTLRIRAPFEAKNPIVR